MNCVWWVWRTVGSVSGLCLHRAIFGKVSERSSKNMPQVGQVCQERNSAFGVLQYRDFACRRLACVQ